jgi:acetyltransferase-like isoleucine patch superfamily enzyme
MAVVGQLRNFAGTVWRRRRLQQLRRAGMRIAPDCRLIGRRTSFGSEPYLIEIGRHVTISAECLFVTHDGATWVFRDAPGNVGQASPVRVFGTIRVGDNCFIGARSIIMPGVTIGTNSVVGAGSVVTKDVPPGMVYAGNPAHFICTVADYEERAERTYPHLHWRGRHEKRAILEATFWHEDTPD